MFGAWQVVSTDSPSKAELYGLLRRVSDLGLTLISAAAIDEGDEL